MRSDGGGDGDGSTPLPLPLLLLRGGADDMMCLQLFFIVFSLQTFS